MTPRRFVTFPLGEERFALDSSQVKELVMPSRVYSFPHTMPSLEGVLIRRGAAIPVCDLGAAFGHGTPRSLYLIAQCNYAGRAQTVAIPVSGDCELVQGERDAMRREAVTFRRWPVAHRRQRRFLCWTWTRLWHTAFNPSIALAREAKR